MNSKYIKLIFCHRSHEGVIGGLPIGDNRVMNALEQCFDEVVVKTFNVEPTKFDNQIAKLRYKLSQISNHYDDNVLKAIISLIENPDKTVVFVSHSIYGYIEKRIKKAYPQVRVSTFFHNEELDVVRIRWKRQKNIGNIVDALFRYLNEKQVYRYSDDLFMLNERDRDQFCKYYGHRDITLLPFTLIDKCKDIQIRKNPEDRLRLLFVGTYFYGNVAGVKAFVNSVMEGLQADLYVVGNKMDSLKTEMPELSNVHYVGRVSDDELEEHYFEADIVVAPVVVGGGMKTKVVEAIMYGCPVIGTNEAFQGYEHFVNEIGFCTDQIAEFKKYILRLDKDRDELFRLSLSSRETFVNNYSNERSVEILRNIYK